MRKAQNQNICSNYKPLITAFACHEMQSAKEFVQLNPKFQTPVAAPVTAGAGGSDDLDDDLDDELD